MTFLGWCMAVGIGGIIGYYRGNTIAGALYGFIMGLLGWVLAAIAIKEFNTCPYCINHVPMHATVCPVCGRAITPLLPETIKQRKKTTLIVGVVASIIYFVLVVTIVVAYMVLYN